MRVYLSLIAILGLALVLLSSSLFLALRPEPPISRALPLPYPSFSPESISKELTEKSKALETQQAQPQQKRADASFKREGRTYISGGLLMVPPSFSSSDGQYDIVFHFHGNTELVAESFARVNAVLMIFNLGTGSAVYEQHFASPAVFGDILRRIRADLEKRGLENAQFRRIALSAWSAGYGSVHALLRHQEWVKSIDAVLLADGLHCGFGSDKKVNLSLIKPFVRFAKLAYEHKKLFSIAHSEIASTPTSAGPQETVDALLNWLHIRRLPFNQEPALPSFDAARKAVADEFWIPLSPETKAEMGGFIVRGYGGQKEEHHMMHLIQISETVLPDLLSWWSKKSSN